MGWLEAFRCPGAWGILSKVHARCIYPQRDISDGILSAHRSTSSNMAISLSRTIVKSIPSSSSTEFTVSPETRVLSSRCVTCGRTDWAQHGICGRGVLLDIVRYYTASGSPLPYDPWTTHAIPAEVLQDCAAKQGVTFRRGDILLIRFGFMQRYNAATQAERDSLSGKEETLCVTSGLAGSPADNPLQGRHRADGGYEAFPLVS